VKAALNEMAGVYVKASLKMAGAANAASAQAPVGVAGESVTLYES